MTEVRIPTQAFLVRFLNICIFYFSKILWYAASAALCFERSDVFNARIDMLHLLMICFLKQCLLCMINVWNVFYLVLRKFYFCPRFTNKLLRLEIQSPYQHMMSLLRALYSIHCIRIAFTFNHFAQKKGAFFCAFGFLFKRFGEFQ